MKIQHMKDYRMKMYRMKTCNFKSLKHSVLVFWFVSKIIKNTMAEAVVRRTKTICM